MQEYSNAAACSVLADDSKKNKGKKIVGRISEKTDTLPPMLTVV